MTTSIFTRSVECSFLVNDIPINSTQLDSTINSLRFSFAKFLILKSSKDSVQRIVNIDFSCSFFFSVSVSPSLARFTNTNVYLPRGHESVKCIHLIWFDCLTSTKEPLFSSSSCFFFLLFLVVVVVSVKRRAHISFYRVVVHNERRFLSLSAIYVKCAVFCRRLIGSTQLVASCI